MLLPDAPETPSSSPLSRRAFLKGTGAAAVSTALLAPARTLEASGKAENAADAGASPVDFVNILQGTASSHEFSRGNTLPLAALPFGMAHWTLQSNTSSGWFFQPGARRIQGFRCTHQLSPWLGDYGYATFLPFRGDIRPEPEARTSSYAVEQAKLTPYALALFLLRSRARAELIPTERGALLTASFEPDELAGDVGLLFDAPGPDGAVQPDPAKRRILFESRVNAGGTPENFSTYYVLQVNEAWESFNLQKVEGHRIGILRFGKRPGFDARIATSFLSFEQAVLNLEREVGDQSAEALRRAARDRWNETLDRIEITGATEEQRRTFYSCLYRVLLFPRTFHDSTRSAPRTIQRLQRQAHARRNVRRSWLLGCVPRLHDGQPDRRYVR